MSERQTREYLDYINTASSAEAEEAFKKRQRAWLYKETEQLSQLAIEAYKKEGKGAIIARYIDPNRTEAAYLALPELRKLPDWEESYFSKMVAEYDPKREMCVMIITPGASGKGEHHDGYRWTLYNVVDPISLDKPCTLVASDGTRIDVENEAKKATGH